jgi:hypothetical protein
VLVLLCATATVLVLNQDRFVLYEEQSPEDAKELAQDDGSFSVSVQPNISLRTHSATHLLVENHLSSHFLESPLHTLRKLLI